MARSKWVTVETTVGDAPPVKPAKSIEDIEREMAETMRELAEVTGVTQSASTKEMSKLRSLEEAEKDLAAQIRQAQNELITQAVPMRMRCIVEAGERAKDHRNIVLVVSPSELHRIRSALDADGQVWPTANKVSRQRAWNGETLAQYLARCAAATHGWPVTAAPTWFVNGEPMPEDYEHSNWVVERDGEDPANAGD